MFGLVLLGFGVGLVFVRIGFGVRWFALVFVGWCC